jgi:hypothetical protein
MITFVLAAAVLVGALYVAVVLDGATTPPNRVLYGRRQFCDGANRFHG